MTTRPLADFFARQRFQTQRLKTCFGGKIYVDYWWAFDGLWPRVAGVAIVPAKMATDVEFNARSAANMICCALEAGASIKTLRDNVTRDGEGRPLDLIGHALDLIVADFAALGGGFPSGEDPGDGVRMEAA